MSAVPSKNKRARTASAAVTAARTVVQILTVTGRRFTLDGLREKLREFYAEEGRVEIRAAASLSAVQLLSALLELNETLAAAGLQIRVVNGLVSLGTTRIEEPRLSEYLARETPSQGAAGDITPSMMEILACIAFKQPVSHAEIERVFGGVDKRALVVRLREMGLVEDFAGPDGRLQFATTALFLERFSLTSLDELRTLPQHGQEPS
ncbi:MAG: scpB [Verrucomicrobiales bacterium]|nr:scpB [Verrucomicrobiales bacterium]